MRHSYDCLIVGDDPAACLIALRLQKAGFHSALITSAATPSGTGHWLMPTDEQAIAWTPASDELPDAQRFVQRQTTLELIPAIATQLAPRPHSVALIDAEDYQWECRSVCRRRGIALLEEGERPLATLTIAPSAGGHDSQPLIWGNYRQVSRQPGPQGGMAFVFASQTGAQWWLVPLDDETTSVGMKLPPPACCPTELRNAWEDELVACPAIVERLFDAQLSGSLRFHWPTPTAPTAPSQRVGYAPCPTPSPVDCPVKSLLAAGELAESIGGQLRQAPLLK